MTGLGKMFHYVHCHLCPLKDLCNFSAPDTSYAWQQHIRSDNQEVFSGSLEKLKVATVNCPLKKAVLERT